MEQNKPSKLSEEKYLYQVFKFFDGNNDECVTKDEFIKCVNKIGYSFLNSEVKF